MIEWKAIIFKSLHVWLAAYNSFHFSDFLEFLSFYCYLIGFLLNTPCTSNKIEVLIKKVISNCRLVVLQEV